MKKLILLILVATCVGCSGMSKDGVKFSEYFTQPRNFINDPHFAEYKENRDEIETMYLNKEIGYVEYTSKMEALETKYTAEVNARDSIIHE